MSQNLLPLDDTDQGSLPPSLMDSTSHIRDYVFPNPLGNKPFPIPV
ncbi:hypothetical protein SAMN02949497_4712 [Methylomagnum ishizawai]|uniref:Uncharacterized protein n=1 Tax=Methylomagnum ishizawai TaxID=1760988 RepID=A0A1Y6D4D6_9GAMM|nr:hypothetical protein SAMN02949497_4712 [Methylomagnum ishizawai]